LLVLVVLAFASADANVDASTVVPELYLSGPKTAVTFPETPVEPPQNSPKDESQRLPDPSVYGTPVMLYAREQGAFADQLRRRLKSDPKFQHLFKDKKTRQLAKHLGMAFHHHLIEAHAEGNSVEEIAQKLERSIESLKGDDKKSHAYAMNLMTAMNDHPVYKEAETHLVEAGATAGSKTKLVFCTSAVLFACLKISMHIAMKVAMTAARVAIRMLPRVMKMSMRRGIKFAQRIVKMMPKNLSKYGRHFVKESKRFYKTCKRKNSFCSTMIKRLKKELKKEIKEQIKDKFQDVLDDQLGETCGFPQACQGNIFVDVFSHNQHGHEAYHRRLEWDGKVFKADSINHCAWLTWDINQHWKDTQITGASWDRSTGTCYATRKLDPVNTQDYAGSKPGWDSCLVRGPCQTVHVGDFQSSREEHIGGHFEDITHCAWIVAWTKKGANGATLYGGNCYAEFGADPYEKGFADHAELVHSGHQSCVLWETQGEKVKEDKKKYCKSKGKSGKSCGRARKNRFNLVFDFTRPAVTENALVQSSLPKVPLSVQEQFPTTASKANRKLLGGRGHQGHRRRRGDQEASAAFCAYEEVNELMNPCMPFSESIQGADRTIDADLGYMHGDLQSTHEIHLGKATSLADCANMVSVWAEEDDNRQFYTGATWYQPDSTLAEGECWAEQMGSNFNPMTTYVHRGHKDHKHQNCIIDLSKDADTLHYKRDIGLVAPFSKTCEAQGWLSPQNQHECKQACDLLHFSGAWYVHSWTFTTPGCFVTEYTDGSYGNCHWNTYRYGPRNYDDPVQGSHPSVCKQNSVFKADTACSGPNECPASKPYRYPNNNRCFPWKWGGHACNVDPANDPVDHQRGDTQCVCP